MMLMEKSLVRNYRTIAYLCSRTEFLRGWIAIKPIKRAIRAGSDREEHNRNPVQRISPLT
jgi:hypothetical protein